MNERYIRQALSLASDEANRSKLNYKLGAVIYNSKGKICGTGYNQRKTHPFQATYARKAKIEHKANLHAEIAAVLDALRNSTERPYGIAVVRKTKSGFGLARPCPICMGAIIDIGIKEIRYTTSDNKIYEVIKL